MENWIRLNSCGKQGHVNKRPFIFKMFLQLDIFKATSVDYCGALTILIASIHHNCLYPCPSVLASLNPMLGHVMLFGWRNQSTWHIQTLQKSFCVFSFSLRFLSLFVYKPSLACWSQSMKPTKSPQFSGVWTRENTASRKFGRRYSHKIFK